MSGKRLRRFPQTHRSDVQPEIPPGIPPGIGPGPETFNPAFGPAFNAALYPGYPPGFSPGLPPGFPLGFDSEMGSGFSNYSNYGSYDCGSYPSDDENQQNLERSKQLCEKRARERQKAERQKAQEVWWRRGQKFGQLVFRVMKFAAGGLVGLAGEMCVVPCDHEACTEASLASLADADLAHDLGEGGVLKRKQGDALRRPEIIGVVLAPNHQMQMPLCHMLPSNVLADQAWAYGGRGYPRLGHPRLGHPRPGHPRHRGGSMAGASYRPRPFGEGYGKAETHLKGIVHELSGAAKLLALPPSNI